MRVRAQWADLYGLIGNDGVGEYLVFKILRAEVEEDVTHLQLRE